MNDVIQEWIKFANSDLKTAQKLMQDEDSSDFYHVICFHAQQCLEKSLKALGLFENNTVIKTHSIKKLLDNLSKEVNLRFSDIELEMIAFDAFYTSTRYPDIVPGSLGDRLPEQDDAEQAIKISSEVFHRVANILKNL